MIMVTDHSTLPVIHFTPLGNMQLLICAGANTNLVAKHIATPLIEALRESNDVVANYLVSRNADIVPIYQNNGGVLHFNLGERSEDVDRPRSRCEYSRTQFG